MIPATYLYHLIPVDAGGADGLFTSLENILEEDGVGWERSSDTHWTVRTSCKERITQC